MKFGGFGELFFNRHRKQKIICNEHSPHILGVSECELMKVNGQFSEENVKLLILWTMGS